MIPINKRTSFIETEFRADVTEQDELIVEGYFIRFDSETELYPGVFEQVSPESVDDSLENEDIRSLFNHDDNLVLGRTGNNTLKLRKDEKGLFGQVIINKDDSEAMNAYARIKRGDVVGCSFGFMPIDQDYAENGERTDITIRKMRLFEVSPCVFPAYPQTEISARKTDVEKFRKEQLENKKKELKERLNNG
ncbi:MAG TPA: HK97 family phage prohead protease [Atopostipes sp.]|nr:HK97 family phage prohead protease [Atopostipes sp.]